MIIRPTTLPGAFIVEPEPHGDERGIFARTFCSREFRAHGLADAFVQCSTSFTTHAGTIRGLHYQLPPAGETKLVRCTAGAIHDVIVDLRPQSPTHGQHFSAELTAQNRRALYIPEMFAHGFQTLKENTEVFYQMTAFFTPEKTTGMHFEDPKLAIRWPLPVTVISERIVLGRDCPNRPALLKIKCSFLHDARWSHHPLPNLKMKRLFALRKEAGFRLASL